MTKQTVLFDLDGTLLDTLDDLAGSTNAALAACGYPLRQKDEVRAFVGNGVEKLIERAVPAGTPRADMLACLAVFREHYSRHMEDHTAPYPGILTLLEHLRAQGCRMAIISNKFDAAVKALNARWFSQWIEAAVGESPAVRKKPAPDTVLAAMAQLEANPASTLYVGDSDVDVQTARAAGIAVCGVTWGFRSRALLEEAGADYVVDTAQELEDRIVK
ncbi:MAG: HAD-IA family hydrolase [Eubacteriales bacterium]|nr:HAD-IA family hydrolase [Eubacteriales bacterium]